jgi:hypothetical protein
MAARMAELGLGIFLVVSLIVGVRLLALARRTRRLPELLVGAGFVVGGALGYVPENLVLQTDVVPHPWQPFVSVGAHAAILVSALLMAIFTWRVFRPHDVWAAGLVVAFAVLLALGFSGHPVPWDFAESSSDWWWAFFTSTVRSAAFGWGAVEALRAGLAARRRAALGLAEWRGVERLLLWALAMGAVTLMSSTLLVVRTVTELAGHPLANVWESVLGLTAAAAMARTFFGGRAAAAQAVTDRA